MSVGPKYGFFGLRLSQMRHRSVTLCMMRCCIKHVSRVGTHRPNEWEGRCGLIRCSPRCAGRKKKPNSKLINVKILNNRTPSFRQAPNVYNSALISIWARCVRRTPHAENIYYFYITITINVFAVEQKRGVGFANGIRNSRHRTRATPGTPKTPVFGLPKSRPSPLQKTPFFALSEAKSVQFRPICARKCTFLTPFLRT
jgi:hypothetical protein